MGSIARHVQPTKTTWVARWRDPDGKQGKRSFARKVDADRFLATVSADVVRGDYVDPNDRTTVREYAEAWRNSRVHRPTTAAQVETSLRRPVYPTFGDRRMSPVLPGEFQAWVSRLSRTLSPSTVQVIHGIFAATYKSAIRAGSSIGPRVRARSSGASCRARSCRSQPQTVEALIVTVPARYRAAVFLAAGTGLRQGECFGVTQDRLDLDRQPLRVDQQVILLPSRPPFLAPPKTSASHRTIPLPKVVCRSSSDTEFHDLRHYYASLLIRHGETIKTVQRRLGHATAAETLDTYAHLWPDSDDRTREAIDSVLGASTEDDTPQPEDG